MPALVWDKTGERFFETGVDHGVLFPISDLGAYGAGIPWNGLTAVTESPSGADLTDFWADNIKYASVRAAEEFGATIEAYTYPAEFAACDGSATLVAGVQIGQQPRKRFGFVYRTSINNDVGKDRDESYKIHIIYNASASPSEKSYGTINDSPEAMTFSWEIEASAVSGMAGFKPTACVVIDSNKLAPGKLTLLLETLFGSATKTSSLPTPAALQALLA